jgi:hypothetical protein
MVRNAAGHLQQGEHSQIERKLQTLQLFHLTSHETAQFEGQETSMKDMRVTILDTLSGVHRETIFDTRSLIAALDSKQDRCMGSQERS